MQPFTMVDTEIAMPNREEGEFWRASYWDSVAARDRAMDGVFFYGVMSTGVYCRPSCPSKRPRRENVVFFRAREAAERAGFRPCKRCKPDSADQRGPNAQLVEKVCRYIVQHPFAPRPKCTRESLDDAYPTLVVTWLCCSKPSAVVRRILAPIAMPLLTEPESFRCG